MLSKPVQTLSPTLLCAQQLLDVVLDLGNSTAKPVAARDDRLALVRAANRDAFGLVFQYFRGQWEAIAAKFGPYGASAMLEQVAAASPLIHRHSLCRQSCLVACSKAVRAHFMIQFVSHQVHKFLSMSSTIERDLLRYGTAICVRIWGASQVSQRMHVSAFLV